MMSLGTLTFMVFVARAKNISHFYLCTPHHQAITAATDLIALLRPVQRNIKSTSEESADGDGLPFGVALPKAETSLIRTTISKSTVE
jgi:hypothetical protein